MTCSLIIFYTWDGVFAIAFMTIMEKDQTLLKPWPCPFLEKGLLHLVSLRRNRIFS